MKHPHAELARLYAEDMMNSETPWENWEAKTMYGGWVSLLSNPIWSETQEYRRRTLTKKQVEEGWIERTGDSCPVDKDSYPEILLKNGRTIKGLKASFYDWSKSPFSAAEIVAYKLGKTPLSAEDISVGSFLGNEHCAPIIIVDIFSTGVKYYEHIDENINFISYVDMMKQNWKINKFNQRDKDGNPTTWSPCYK